MPQPLDWEAPFQKALDAFERDGSLPFEGDQTLSVILSKAFLLADDGSIVDPTITRQIRPAATSAR
jgi:hypothetical protein